MAKDKHDGLLCFLLAVIVVLILVIGAGAYYFLVIEKENDVKQNINNIENDVLGYSEQTDITIEQLSKEEIDYFSDYFIKGACNGFLASNYSNIKDAKLDFVLYTYAQCKPDNEDFNKLEETGVFERSNI